MRSRYIQNRIFALLSDCKRHNVKEIAEKLEVNESTVYRHIQDLSKNYMITTFTGGREHGGTQLVDLNGNNILSKGISIRGIRRRKITCPARSYRNCALPDILQWTIVKQIDTKKRK